MAKIRDYRIVIGSSCATNERRAASFITRYIRLMTGVEPLTVTDDAQPQPLEIVVGRTNREGLDGISFQRAPERQWEFQVLSAGCRIYVTGLGCPASDKAEAQIVKDGCVGTVFAAYHFVEQILGYEFVYETYDSCPFVPDKEMPENYAFTRTMEALEEQLPPPVDGTAMYSLPTHARAELNQYCLIFKTRQGKLVVVDGGRKADIHHLLRCLRALSGKEKPVVSAWFMTHTHDDHCGGFLALCKEPELAAQVKIEHFYHHFATKEFYLEYAVDHHPDHYDAAVCMRECANVIDTQVHILQTGDVVEVDELKFETLYVPDIPADVRCCINDSSLVFKLTHDSGQTMLLLVDAEGYSAKTIMKNCPEKLQSDIVQVAHHGCLGVPYEGYRLIGAKAALFTCCPRYWYGENGEGLYTYNVGHIRTRNFLRELGIKKENIYRDSNSILAFHLPLKIN